MTQKQWEINNTKIVTEYICVNCCEHIIHHAHYNDNRFCEECNKEITEDYNRKCNDPDDAEQIKYFGWSTADKFLESVYEELEGNYFGIDERMEALTL